MKKKNWLFRNFDKNKKKNRKQKPSIVSWRWKFSCKTSWLSNSGDKKRIWKKKKKI